MSKTSSSNHKKNQLSIDRYEILSVHLRDQIEGYSMKDKPYCQNLRVQMLDQLRNRFLSNNQ